MGYTHGKKWNQTTIENELKEVMRIANIETMPTHSLMNAITGNCGLSLAVSRNGGTKYWASRIGVEIKYCETELGYLYESECMGYLINNYGYECERTKERYPYDLLVNRNIKVDVKSGNLYHGIKGDYYTFNLAKAKPICDIYVCYCMDDGVKKVYIIPSCVLSGKTQLSIGKFRSKYDKYIDNWELFKTYNDFYENLIV